jgi:hypothetical protein
VCGWVIDEAATDDLNDWVSNDVCGDETLPSIDVGHGSKKKQLRKLYELYFRSFDTYIIYT